MHGLINRIEYALSFLRIDHSSFVCVLLEDLNDKRIFSQTDLGPPLIIIEVCRVQSVCKACLLLEGLNEERISLSNGS